MKRWKCTTAMSASLAAALCIGMHTTADLQQERPASADGAQSLDRPIKVTPDQITRAGQDHPLVQKIENALPSRGLMSPLQKPIQTCGVEILYSNVENFVPSAFLHGSNIFADDLVLEAVDDVNEITFSLAHFADSVLNDALLSLHFWELEVVDGALQEPVVGEELAVIEVELLGANLDPATLSLWVLSAGEDPLFTAPASGLVWAGLSVNDAIFAGAGTVDDVGQVFFDPPTCGASDDVSWLEGTGLVFFGGDPVSNFAWELRSDGQVGACCFEEDVPDCPEDITGPDGVPDGVVDVFDLLAVIGAWGACSDPQDCPEDITGPNNEPDGVVDVFDLLAVIGAWGACPGPESSIECQTLSPPDCGDAGGNFAGFGEDACDAPGICEGLGACCLPDGDCVDQITAEDCDAVNGLFTAPGVLCENVDCPSPGDSCANAVSVTIDGPTEFVDTTDFPQAAALTCEGVPLQGQHLAWFEVVGDGSTLTASTCNPNDLDNTIDLAVFCNTCPTPVCVDAAAGVPFECPGGEGSIGQSSVEWCSIDGESYFIAAWRDGVQTSEIAMTVTSADDADCPNPVDCEVSGACCIDGNCTEDVLSTDCEAQGGELTPDALCEEIVCLACGDPEAGDCCQATGTPFCDDEAGEGCCAAVCAGDPFCCDVEWDGFCAGGGFDPDCLTGPGTCGALNTPECDCGPPPECGAGAGDCCLAGGNGTAACEDEDCCAEVCAVDPFCCNTEWDEICADIANDICDLCQ